MKDVLGRFWKVEKNKFLCYTKTETGSRKPICELDIAFPAGIHSACGGAVCGFKYQYGSFQLCSKCAAEVR